jgi:autotransporter adhesin
LRAAVVLAASTLTLAATTNAAQPATHATTEPVRVVRAMIVSGDGQSAHAYVANGKRLYEAGFPAALVVRIPSQPQRKEFFHVIFTCVSQGCTFVATDQPDGGEFLDRVKHGDVESDNAYDVKIHNGVAALRVTIDSPTLRTVVVRADPVVQNGERAVPTSFSLRVR